MKRFPKLSSLTLVLVLVTANPVFAMIDVGTLSPQEAKELGITMKSRPNGDAGIKVWIEFKKEGFLKNFTYAELRMRDNDGDHLLSARLESHPVVHGQAAELVTLAFSAQPSQLDKCSFLVVAYGSSRGDVGYYLKVTDFIDP